MNAGWVVWTIIDGGDTKTLLAGKKKFELYALSGGWDAKTFSIPLTRASAPYEPPGETFTI